MNILVFGDIVGEKTLADSILSNDNEFIINACVFIIDEKTGKTIDIKRIYIK